MLFERFCLTCPSKNCNNGGTWVLMGATWMVADMKNLLKSRTILLAGLAMASVFAAAGGYDQQVQITKATDNRTLTVRYAGAKASLIELRINGVSAATRSATADRANGEANFTLDTSKLSEGDNQIEVRLYDEAGKIVGSEKTTVVMDRAASGPVFLAKPQDGATLQGMVEISVGFKSQMKGSYVSFFVNDEFKALKNYAPYTYLWDTNTVANGWHEVEAWVVDESSNTFRTERMRVFVNNPNGQTGRESLPKNGSGTEPRESLGKTKQPDMVAKVTPKAVVSPMLGTSDNRVKPVTAKVVGMKSAPHGEGVMTGTRLMRPTGQRVAGESPNRGTATAPKVLVDTSVPSPVKSNVVVLHKPAPKKATPAKAVATTKTSIVAGTKLPNIGYYPITVNGTLVKFDVMPRVDNGVALTPFRHLFEHVGGKVSWENTKKQVEAKGTGQNINFRIGQDFAMVNGGRVSFERAAFLEAGRAIVPLSFMQQALNVDVKYDPSTQHVLITKSK